MAADSKEPVRVGLVGCGTVGKGVAKILTGRKNLIAARVGRTVELARVADLDPGVVSGLGLAEGVFTTDAFAVVDDPRIPIIVELIGGETFARDLVVRALEQGKAVVTANKALIASQAETLFRAAQKGGGELFFEAAVGGAMPVIKTLRETLAGNKVGSLFGILNGTCNYILSKITAEGVSFEEALAEAQAEGFAEADPTLDVSGMDTVHKLAICTSLAFGTRVDYRDIHVEGISHVTSEDIEFAKGFRYRIKLLAITKNLDDAVEARVHPTMVPEDNMLSNVTGSMNAVTLMGDAVGELVLYGHGAGMMPTGSAVVQDIVDIARNMDCGAGCRVPMMSFQPESLRDLPVLPMDEVVTRYYIRFAALDRPGVLSKISGVLGNHQISISSVHQKGRETDGPVPIVLLTHEAREADVQHALADIEKLDVIASRPVLIRIEDENGD